MNLTGLTPDQIRIPELQLTMRCDAGVGCKGLVEYAAAAWVPSRFPLRQGHAQLRMITDLHCCEGHRGFVDRETFFSDHIKTVFEGAARKKRPVDFVCEFDNAMITYLDVREDEYKAFLMSPRGKALLAHAVATARSAEAIIRPKLLNTSAMVQL